MIHIHQQSSLPCATTDSRRDHFAAGNLYHVPRFLPTAAWRVAGPKDSGWVYTAGHSVSKMDTAGVTGAIEFSLTTTYM